MSGTADCDPMRLLVQADLDGELAVAEAAALEVHLQGCAACRGEQAALADLSRRLRTTATRHAAPQALRAALQTRLARPTAPPVRPTARWPRVGVATGAALALAASVVLLLPQRDAGLAETVADHVRALQPGHLTDVLSTDQHTVKPWFDGRIDFAPPVRDFASAGFPLVGGRLDYLGGRAVAALVYRRDKHLIDVFVWPAAGGAHPGDGPANGYNVVGWTRDGMRFAAVSDLNAQELAAFAGLWQAD